MRLQLKVGENGVIEDAKFKTFGCGSAIASSYVLSFLFHLILRSFLTRSLPSFLSLFFLTSSYTTTWLIGKNIDEAVKLKNTEIASHLNLPPVKLHCSMLAEDAVKVLSFPLPLTLS
jgi:nitrogen fixation NifU-like protein